MEMDRDGLTDSGNRPTNIASKTDVQRERRLTGKQRMKETEMSLQRDRQK